MITTAAKIGNKRYINRYVEDRRNEDNGWRKALLPLAKIAADVDIFCTFEKN